MAMEEMAREVETDSDYDYGYRYIAGPATVGEELPVSHEWSEHDERGEELRGTCCFETVAGVCRYADGQTGSIVVVRGVYVGSGELPGETLIAEAEVAAILRG